MRHAFTAFAAALSISLPALAEESAKTPPPPCASDDYRAFDFWLGEWDVFLPDGTQAGENSITVQESGCLVLEKWTSAGGGTGQSYNFYDPGRKKWRQVWVSAFGTIDYAGGLNAAGEMVLEGEIATRDGKTAPFRGTWTLQDDGSVRQYFQQYDDETDAWNDWFTGIYRKKPE